MKNKKGKFETIELAVRRRYASFKRIYGKSMAKDQFKSMVVEVFIANGYTKKDISRPERGGISSEARKRFEAIMIHCGSRGGTKNAAKLQAKKLPKNAQTEFEF